jgi:hypothetical protein
MTDTICIFEINELVWNIVSFLPEADKLRMLYLNRQFYSIISNLFNMNEVLGRWRYAKYKIKLKSYNLKKFYSSLYLALSEQIYISEWGIFVQVVTYDQITTELIVWSSLDNSVVWILNLDFKFSLVEFRLNNFHFSINSGIVVYHVTCTKSIIFQFSDNFEIIVTFFDHHQNLLSTSNICNQCLQLQTNDFVCRLKEFQTLYQNRDNLSCVVGKFGMIFVTYHQLPSQSTRIVLQKKDVLFERTILNSTSVRFCKTSHLLIIHQEFDQDFDNYQLISSHDFRNYVIKIQKNIKPSQFFCIDNSIIFGYSIESNRTIRLLFDRRSSIIQLKSALFYNQIVFCPTTKKLLIRILGYNVISIDVMFYYNKTS